MDIKIDITRLFPVRTFHALVFYILRIGIIFLPMPFDAYDYIFIKEDIYQRKMCYTKVIF